MRPFWKSLAIDEEGLEPSIWVFYTKKIRKDGITLIAGNYEISQTGKQNRHIQDAVCDVFDEEQTEPGSNVEEDADRLTSWVLEQASKEWSVEEIINERRKEIEERIRRTGRPPKTLEELLTDELKRLTRTS